MKAGISQRMCSINTLPGSQSCHTQHVCNKAPARDAAAALSISWGILSGSIQRPQLVIYWLFSPSGGGKCKQNAYASRRGDADRRLHGPAAEIVSKAQAASTRVDFIIQQSAAIIPAYRWGRSKLYGVARYEYFYKFNPSKRGKA